MLSRFKNHTKNSVPIKYTEQRNKNKRNNREAKTHQSYLNYAVHYIYFITSYTFKSLRKSCFTIGSSILSYIFVYLLTLYFLWFILVGCVVLLYWFVVDLFAVFVFLICISWLYLYIIKQFSYFQNKLNLQGFKYPRVQAKDPLIFISLTFDSNANLFHFFNKYISKSSAQLLKFSFVVFIFLYFSF